MKRGKTAQGILSYLMIVVLAITEEDTVQAFRKMKHQKSPVPAGLYAKLIKYRPRSFLPV